MTQMTTIAELKARTAGLPSETRMDMFSLGGFELMQRAANMLASSTLVPSLYQGNMSNCVVALNMAQRLRADPLMIMQNLYIVEGRPAWSSQFIIAAINACGKFSPLRFEIIDKGEKSVKWQYFYKDRKSGEHRERSGEETIHDFSCVAWATEKATGEKICSPAVSIEMAVREGWYIKRGSKWKTMPEVMLRYRAASFFGKLYAPELLVGVSTTEEIQDAVDYVQQADGSFAPAAEEAAPTITTADISAQVEQQQLAEEPMQQEAAPAPQTEATADREAEKKAKEAALEDMRSETVQLCLSAGMDEKAMNWAAGGKPRDTWTITDCKRLRKRAEEKRAMQAEQPAAAPGAGEAAPSEEGMLQCPRQGDRVSITYCDYGCDERNGCPAWEK